MFLTAEMLKLIAQKGNDKIISDFVTFFNQYAEKYQINTYLRVCHFIAQAAHETDGFNTLEEYASGAAYEGRADLGNIRKGDGKRYKGRGIFQCTGRDNYKFYGKILGLPLEEAPATAKEPETSMLLAMEYWNNKKLSDYADKDDIKTITLRINGGLNGFDDRKARLALLKTVIPNDEEVVTSPVNVAMAKLGDNSSYVKDLQTMLIRKGATISADGNFGPATQQAVKDFQSKNKIEVTGIIDTDTINKLMVP